MPKGIVKASQLSLGYAPHEAQQKVHRSKAKHKWIEAARRWGKDRCCFGEMMETYRLCLNRSVSHINRYALVPPGMHAWIVVPTYAQGRQIWHELLALIPKGFIRNNEVHRDEMLIYLNGQRPDVWGLIEVKSGFSPEGLQTVGLDHLWVMECQDIFDEAMHRFQPLLRQAGRLGRSTYNGIPSLWSDHWFRRGVEAAGRASTTEHAAFNFTVYDNPLLNEDDLRDVESDKEIMTQDAWDRMYMAKFSSNAGFFKNIDACIAGDLLTEPMLAHNYVAGLDIGIARDFTVMIVMDSDSRQVVYHQFWDSTPWTDISHRVADIHSHWGVQVLSVDATGMGGQTFAQELANMNLNVDPVQITGANRGELLESLAIALERETIHFPAIPLMLRQLRAFQHRRLKGGQWRAEAPSGEHDDEIFALTLALRSCSDAAPALAYPAGRGTSSRYLPTQAEVSGGNGRMSMGRRMMRERKSNKMKERMERAGIVA